MYLLTVIYIFSKFLLIILLKKTDNTVTSEFKSILKKPKYSSPPQTRPIWVRTDKGKEFLNRHFQGMLKDGVFSFRNVVNLT